MSFGDLGEVQKMSWFRTVREEPRSRKVRSEVGWRHGLKLSSEISKV